jgi:hypothetical protein
MPFPATYTGKVDEAVPIRAYACNVLTAFRTNEVMPFARVCSRTFRLVIATREFAAMRLTQPPAVQSPVPQLQMPRPLPSCSMNMH